MKKKSSKKNVAKVNDSVVEMASPSSTDEVLESSPEVTAETAAEVSSEDSSVNAETADNASSKKLEKTDPATARRNVVGFVEAALAHVDHRLEPLKDGEKIFLQTICAEITELTGVPAERVYPITSLYLAQRAGVTVVKGRFGGVFKGSPAAKPVDPKIAEKLQKKASAVEAKIQALQAEAAKLRSKAAHVAS